MKNTNEIEKITDSKKLEEKFAKKSKEIYLKMNHK